MNILYKVLTVLAFVTATLYASPSKCPFVDERTGFECMGMPDIGSICMAGTKYRCSRGHEWIEKN